MDAKMKGELTRNGNTWSESKYWGGVRSALRRLFRFNWIPAKQALEAARRKYEGANKLQKWEFRCGMCGLWKIRKEVELDHVIPCGSLRCLEDVGGFLSRLHPESPDAYQVICKKCHKIKTAEERKNRKTK
jgi:hypothetical protein